MTEQEFIAKYGGEFFYQQLMTYYHMLSTQEEREAQPKTDKLMFEFPEGEYIITVEDLEKHYEAEKLKSAREVEYKVMADYILDNLDWVDEIGTTHILSFNGKGGTLKYDSKETTDEAYIIQLLKDNDPTVLNIIDKINQYIENGE